MCLMFPIHSYFIFFCPSLSNNTFPFHWTVYSVSDQFSKNSSMWFPDVPLLDLQVRQTAITRGPWKKCGKQIIFCNIKLHRHITQYINTCAQSLTTKFAPREYCFHGIFLPSSKKRMKSRVEGLWLLFRRKNILLSFLSCYLRKISNPKK